MFDEWKGLNMSCDVVEIVQVGQDGKEFSIHYPSGPTHYGALVLRHGMSSNNVAWDWMASNYVDGSFEKIPVSITVFDEAMNPVVAFELYGAFPSAWSLNSGAKGIVIEELVVQYDSLRLMSWYP
jgi:phage tail-like protein